MSQFSLIGLGSAWIFLVALSFYFFLRIAIALPIAFVAMMLSIMYVSAIPNYRYAADHGLNPSSSPIVVAALASGDGHAYILSAQEVATLSGEVDPWVLKRAEETAEKRGVFALSDFIEADAERERMDLSREQGRTAEDAIESSPSTFGVRQQAHS